MAVLSLPLTFSNSFWTPDYRTGLEVLFAKLEQVSVSAVRTAYAVLNRAGQGVQENDQIISFIGVFCVFFSVYSCTEPPSSPAPLQNKTSHTLSPLKPSSPPPVSLPRSTFQRVCLTLVPGGFLADDGASLLLTIRGLQSESLTQSSLHLTLSRDLNNLVVEPFLQWALGYRDRIHKERDGFIGEDGLISAYERERRNVDKMRNEVVERRRRADEAEDEYVPPFLLFQ
jgi:hypothetical protein